jgi:tetratricopeptide (TPR) repeat protein
MANALCAISIWLVFLASGCASYQVTGQVNSGRQALLLNDPERALSYFAAAAESDPNYVYHSVHYREGIWTYVGRAQYATAKLKEARQSLERAVAMDSYDNLARLYLGLTLYRSGETARGLKEIEAAMRGLHDWLEYIEQARPFEAFWDPLREIRGAIEKDLEKISTREFDARQIVANAESLGLAMENEIEKVRQDERRQFERDFDRRRGLSLGLGIGF